MRRFGLALVALCALEACSLFFDTDSLQSGTSVDSGDDSGAGNILVNGGFEEGTAACGPGWSASSGATISRSTDAHSGTYSCELCPIGPGAMISLTATPSPSFHLDPTTSFYAEAWVKIEGPSTGQILLDVEELLAGMGGTLVNQKGAPSVTDWQAIGANNFKANDGGTGVTFAVRDTGIDGGAASCVLIDDARLVFQ